jgi:hypothetical protein
VRIRECGNARIREQTRAEDEQPSAKDERSFEASEAGATRGNARIREFWNARIKFETGQCFVLPELAELSGQSVKKHPIHAFAHSRIHAFAHSRIPAFAHSRIPAFAHSPIPEFPHSRIRALFGCKLL